jgi:hypothetical protein
MSELIPWLMTRFVPEEARYRVRQQRLDAEAARRSRRVIRLTGVSVTLVNSSADSSADSSVGVRPRKGRAELVPTPALRYVHSPWLDYGRLTWDGTRLTATGDNGSAAGWLVQEGGVKPGFGAEEVAEAGWRPVTSGECPTSVTEIAAVSLGGRAIRRLYLLDEESRQLTMLPARGLPEDRIIAFATNVGIEYRAYSITTGGRVRVLAPFGFSLS